MIVATAGHIDHGKTTLVKALTGVDTDRLPEEKARGISIDLGFAYWQDRRRRLIGFVDVPGHERFIRNMLAGVCGIDYVMLIVAADDGVMPQTDRAPAHRRSAQRQRAASPSSPRPTASRPSASAEVVAGVRACSPTRALAAIPVLPVSAISGDGIEALRDDIGRRRRAHAAARTRRAPFPLRDRPRVHHRRQRHRRHRHGVQRRGRGRRQADAVARRHRGARARHPESRAARRSRRSPASAARSI